MNLQDKAAASWFGMLGMVWWYGMVRCEWKPWKAGPVIRQARAKTARRKNAPVALVERKDSLPGCGGSVSSFLLSTPLLFPQKYLDVGWFPESLHNELTLAIYLCVHVLICSSIWSSWSSVSLATKDYLPSLVPDTASLQKS